MTFLSYAQNFEDVMLYRALRGVGRGFYVDVGAQHPTNDSVTRAFYERGWRGINIDPVPQWAELLSTERPHDINLQLALGAKGGHKLMFAVADTGLSTDNETFVRRHLEAGYHAESFEVDVRTLDEVCELHDVSTVHFLKIDVEGGETDVIRGFSFERVRPWIVLVEAVEPVTASEGADRMNSYESWEPLLLARGYQFVYDDGLNRFYLAQEKSELRRHFVLPPNPLDGYVRYQEWIKHERILQLDSELKDFTDTRALGAIRIELQQMHDLRHAEQLDHQNLLRDSANRLQRISVLEQENAVLRAQDAQHQAEIEKLASESVNRLQRMAMLERENAVLHARDAQHQAEIERLTSERLNGLQRMAMLEQQNAVLHARDAQRQTEFERLASDDADRLQRVTALERENAALQTQRHAEQLAREEFLRDHASEQDRMTVIQQQLLAERDLRPALEQEIEALRSRHVAQAELSKQLEAKIQSILESSSWRVTKPLRWFRRTLFGGVRVASVARPSRVAASLVERDGATGDWSAKRPWARSVARRCFLALARTGFRYPGVGRAFWRGMALFPGAKSRAILFINKNRRAVGATVGAVTSTIQPAAGTPMPLPLVQMSANVAVVHRRLSAAISLKSANGSGNSNGRNGQTGRQTL